MNKDLYFEYIEDFVNYLVEEVGDNDELFATVVCKFDEAKEIVKHLMLFDDIDFENIYLESPDEKGYVDEFCIELWYNDGVVNFSCDPLKVNGKYNIPCGDKTYLFENCSSKIIPLCEGLDLYFINFDEDCDCDECCCEECCCGCHSDCVEYFKTDDGDIHGFTASKSTDNEYYSYSFYTNDILSRNSISEMLKEFGF